VKITATIEIETPLWTEWEGYEGETDPARLCELEANLLETDSGEFLQFLSEKEGSWKLAVTVVPSDDVEQPLA
jgi:hypothetical protein